jgi:hypothetical protein
MLKLLARSSPKIVEVDIGGISQLKLGSRFLEGKSHLCT